MQPRWELEIPEVAAMVDVLEEAHSGVRHGDARAPVSAHPPVLDEVGRKRDREALLCALRDRGYDLALAMRDVRVAAQGDAKALDAIADRFVLEGSEKDTTVDAFGFPANVGARVFRPPAHKAWDDLVKALRARLGAMEGMVQEREREIARSHERERAAVLKLEEAMSERVVSREERARWDASLLAANVNLDSANERVKELEAEVEAYKSGEFGKRHEDLLATLRKKDEHLSRLRFVVGTLQQKVCKVEERERRAKAVTAKMVHALRRVKTDYYRLKAQVHHKLDALPALSARAIHPVLDKIRLVSTELDQLRSSYRAERHANRLLRNTFAALRGPLTVLVRVRDDARVALGGGKCPVTIAGESELIITTQNGEKPCPRNYRFDKVFGVKATHKDLFAQIEPHLAPIFDGSNLCVMAFGQTGSGKTYTLLGTPTMPGIIGMALDRIYKMTVERPEDQITFNATLLEIYNEQVYDLLSTFEAPLSQSDDGEYKLDPAPTEPLFPSADILNANLSRILSMRALGPTAARGGSPSRSHFVVSVKMTSVGRRVRDTVTSRLTFVDLAGVDGAAAATGSSDHRLVEAAHIDRSLVALRGLLRSVGFG
ncbi:hypothetical protein HK101_005782, partial [Irineochytrium annulatum]